MKVLFGFNVVLGMTSESKSYVDFNEMKAVYQALGSGILGDGKVVNENIRKIIHLYAPLPQNRLWRIFKQNRDGRSKIDLYRIVGWYNLFHGVKPARDSRAQVPEIKRMLEITKKDLDELVRLVECEKLLFKGKRSQPAISLERFLQKCLEEG